MTATIYNHPGWLWRWHHTLELAQTIQRRDQSDWSSAWEQARQEIIAGIPLLKEWPVCKQCGAKESTESSPVDGKKFCNCKGQSRGRW